MSTCAGGESGQSRGVAVRQTFILNWADAADLFRRLQDKGLSPATVQSVRRTLRAALNAHPRLTRNVAKAASGPRAPRHEISPDELWTPAQAKAFLAAQDGDMAALVRLALDTGARIGELLALRWSDVDGTVLTISRTVDADGRFDTPKNDKSRKVDIDACTVAVLQTVRDRQAAQPVADVGLLVFRRPTPQGFKPWRPDSTTHSFQRACSEAGVPVVPFHYLRHACASWLLAGGADVVAVSERLGHWSPAFTLTTYAHAMPGAQRKLARAIGAALG